MGKKARQRNRLERKLHGEKEMPAFVRRPFEGLPGECDLVALREFVPAATADVPLKEGGRSVRLCSLLPGAAPALVRENGDVWVGLQVQHSYRDPSRDLAAALEAALAAAPGDDVVLVRDPGDGPRLQDLLGDSIDLEVHDGFDYWLADNEDAESYAAALERANEAIAPTLRLTSVEAAYWAEESGSREYLRWVMPYDEDVLLDALARLHAAEKDVLVPGARLVGMFRAHGLLVPVWDLPAGTGAEALEEPAAAYLPALEAAMAGPEPLTTAERSARASLAGRQLTLR
ncbi:preprotein translocase SecA [Marmoricola endophyticus]|uniref:Preprotein translocase SecA n=1 Tax=Marmoricola endophyticus TaxID=2040280 RepID=A0A917BL91_9ACTN|nr:DUF5926 family protein [Marmoricola endophyticus]GGF47863.1 preprotein translocase SecA [Marmoricola endophyticus]